MHLNSDTKYKLQLLSFTGLLILVSYLVIKYGLPLFWPFIIGGIIAGICNPVINFLNTRLHLNKSISAIVVISSLCAIVLYFSAIITRGILAQARALIENREKYMCIIDRYACDFCCNICRKIGIDGQSVYDSIAKNVGDSLSSILSKITSFLMGTSIPAIVAITNFFVGIALIIVSVFIIIRDGKSLRENARKSVFYNEIVFLKSRIFSVTKIYIKTQLIIMSIISAECVIGFLILENKYALLLGIFVGVMDALPLLGVGIILIPWTIIYIATQNMVKAAIIFTLFVVCYFTREFLEPRLIGKKVGLNPLVTLISIYI